MKKLPPYIPKMCACCGQTTTYDLAIDRGTALLVFALYRRVREKGVNCVHLRNEMEASPDQYPSWREMIQAGRITSRMVDNVLRAKYHGLLAQVDGGGQGEYLITPKGAKFLRNMDVPRVALIEKATHTKLEYWNETLDRTTFTKLMKKETPFWDFNDQTLAKYAGGDGHNATLL